MCDHLGASANCVAVDLGCIYSVLSVGKRMCDRLVLYGYMCRLYMSVFATAPLARASWLRSSHSVALEACTIRVLQSLNLCTVCCRSLLVEWLNTVGVCGPWRFCSLQGSRSALRVALPPGAALARGWGFAGYKNPSACILALTAARVLVESASRAMPH